MIHSAIKARIKKIEKNNRFWRFLASLYIIMRSRRAIKFTVLSFLDKRFDIKGAANHMRLTRAEAYLMMHRIELDITERCDLRCAACTRSCGLAPSSDIMTVGQVKEFAEDSIKLRWKWQSIMLIGGEPTTHPQLSEVIEALRPYQNYNSRCQVCLMTNGTGAAGKVLAKVPSWVKIINNHDTKLKEDQGHNLPFNVAPVDVGEWDERDMVKCIRTFCCGMGLTRDGYFPCPLGGGIYRVFQMGEGIRGLRNVTFKALDDMFLKTCRYCGVYFEAAGRYKNYDIHTITGSWEDAYRKYNGRNRAPL